MLNLRKMALMGLFGFTQLIFTSNSIGAQEFEANLAKANAGNKIIYGEDNRFQVANYPDAEFREKALSVAGMIKTSKLTSLDDDFFSFTKKKIKDSMNLCDEERFAEEYTLPVCSGFLIGEDTLVTAGHCVSSQFDCSRYSWAFEYTEGTEKIKKSNVYTCKSIVTQALKSSYWKLQDYSVIKLDRPVAGRTPLKLRQKGRPFPGTKLAVIGHPSGLPMKIADGAKVKVMNWKEMLNPLRTIIRHKNFFIANLDTYGGNSGSPVFNLKNGLVEGILIQGADDYVRDDDMFCNRSNRRGNSGFVTEEKVFRITRVPGLTKAGRRIKDKFKGASKTTEKFIYSLRGEAPQQSVFDHKREPDDTDE